MLKDENDFDDSQINTFGILISAPPIYTYVDLIRGKNVPFVGVSSDIERVSKGLGPGEPGAD